MKTKQLIWQVGDCGTVYTGHPETMLSATVPGSIQQDFANAYNYKDYRIADLCTQYDWMEDRYFLYEAVLPNVTNGERVLFVAQGIDYEYEIILNGESILHDEGMFHTVSVDLTNRLNGNDTLGVLIYPVPRVENAILNRDHVRQSCKPGVSYGWDFHPRLIPRGIWQWCGLIFPEKGRIIDWNIDSGLSDDLTVAAGSVSVQIDAEKEYDLQLQIYDSDNQLVHTSEQKNAVELNFCVENPELWWPNGYGEQKLYRFCITLSVDGEKADQVSFSRGFRRLELIPYEGSWDLPVDFPSKAWPQPLTYRINGREIFAQGTNWVCPTVFYGSLTESDYEIQLQAIRSLGMNYIRCWGGAIVNKSEFFELCDRYGLLVWQEFPLSCNCYEDTPHYLELLDRESKSIIYRLKRYTCLAMWCGGNELFMPWSGMTMQSKALRMLNSNCLSMDPETPFLPTSPISDFAHGDYRFRGDNGKDVFQFMNGSNATGYNEIGCASAADMDTLRMIIPADELNEIKLGTSWETHHAIGAWMKDSHLYPALMRYYFGETLNLEQIVDASRLLQGLGYQYIYEEARRQQPRCSMVLNWCFNEPWPTAANNSIFSYDGKMKPAGKRIAAALRPQIPTLRLGKFEYLAGEMADIEVWWLARDKKPLNGTVTVTAEWNGECREIACREVICDEVYRCRKLFGFTFEPSVKEDTMVSLTVTYSDKENNKISSEYALLFRGFAPTEKFVDFRRLL